jgi:hypothetical protein
LGKFVVDNKTTEVKAMVADIEKYLDDLTDAEDIFLTSVKRKLNASSALLSENDSKRLDFIWNKVVGIRENVIL